MKTINFILLSSLLAILFSGCEPRGDDPYLYQLKLKFEDSSGRDLIKGIKYDQTTFLVDINEYIFQSAVGNDPAKNELLQIQIDNNQDECLTFLDGTFEYVASTITYKLQCPHIFGDSFGDNNEHVIISYWHKETNHDPSCSKITCDGKEFQVIKEGDLGYTALITLTP